IQAFYSGDITYTSRNASLTQNVNPLPASKTTLVSSVNPSVVGQAVTFTATVSDLAIPGNPAPSGSVDFWVNGAYEQTVAVDALGVAQFTRTFTSPSSVTPPPVQAFYHASGANPYRPSNSATLIQQVNKAGTTTTLSASSNPVIPNATVIFTAHV